MFRVDSIMGVLGQDNSPRSLLSELPSLGLGAPPQGASSSRVGIRAAPGESQGTQPRREQRPTEGSRRARLPGGRGVAAALPLGSSLLPTSSASSILLERPSGRPR